MTDFGAGSAIAADRQMSIGRVFSRAFGAIGANPLTMFGIAFLFGALPTALLNVIIGDERNIRGLGYTVATVSTAIVSGLLIMAFVFFAQGALVRVVVAQGEGRRVGLGEAATIGVRKLLPLLGLGILIGLGVMVGLILLIVPGILLYVIWSVATPALVQERIGIFGAFARSAALTRGVRWSVFAVQLLLLLLYWAVSAVSGIVMLLIFGLQGLATAMQGGSPVVFILINGITSTIVFTLVAAIQASLYVELRAVKDGPDIDTLDAIFA